MSSFSHLTFMKHMIRIQCAEFQLVIDKILLKRMLQAPSILTMDSNGKRKTEKSCQLKRIIEELQRGTSLHADHGLGCSEHGNVMTRQHPTLLRPSLCFSIVIRNDVQSLQWNTYNMNILLLENLLNCAAPALPSTADWSCSSNNICQSKSSSEIICLADDAQILA